MPNSDPVAQSSSHAPLEVRGQRSGTGVVGLELLGGELIGSRYFFVCLFFAFVFSTLKGKHSRPRDPGVRLPFCHRMRWDFVKVLSKVGLVQERRPHLWSQAPLSPSFSRACFILVSEEAPDPEFCEGGMGSQPGEEAEAGPTFLAAVEMRWSGSVAEKQKATW